MRLTAGCGPLRRTLARSARRLVETRAIERLGYAWLGDGACEPLGLSPRKLPEPARIDSRPESGNCVRGGSSVTRWCESDHLKRQLCARQLCARGVDPEETERLRGWVPVEVALLFAGVNVKETLRRRLEVEQGRSGAGRPER